GFGERRQSLSMAPSKITLIFQLYKCSHLCPDRRTNLFKYLASFHEGALNECFRFPSTLGATSGIEGETSRRAFSEPSNPEAGRLEWDRHGHL
ncbi:MAG: hypothetical protein L0Y50_04720, partial [Beijerinckiaceae bacterium]|nr:hypothetical protein [Beijerinckiaceae bacterium]